MNLELELGGKTRLVSVERLGHDRFRVVLDGTLQVVNATRTGEYGLSVLSERDGGQAISREVWVAPGGAAGEVLVTLEGRTIAVAVNGGRFRRAGGDVSGGALGQQAITAPMPGRVVRVLVGPGDEVAARQTVVVMEAMKMENELRASRAGRVKDVNVAAGASVEAGRVLVVIE